MSAETLAEVALLVAVLVLLGFYVSWRAGRLDRLHTRVEAAQAALDAALIRRSAVTMELAASGALDPAASLLLAEAAQAARRAGDADHRELAESDLSRALRAVIGRPERGAAVAGADGGAELLAELDAACNQVYLARRFYNDAVAVTRVARSRRVVRALRLAGSAQLPGFFEIDDDPPERVPAARGEQDSRNGTE
ncbi:MAG: hypothetical protein GEV11_01150 [Streptosporangiales bacterium]|nr:hypothetical protein [Streptosporangiales bacterium]